MAKRLGLPISRATMVRRILAYADAAFLEAGESYYDEGLVWYSTVRTMAWELAAEYRVNYETVAYVIAATSPRTMWSFNVKHARAILAGEDMPSGALKANHARGVAVMNYGIRHIGAGPKVNAFARNIVGDEDSVTIDMWAFIAACGDLPAKYLRRAGSYELVADAYRIAAKKFGISPAQMQAVVWVAIRGRAD